MIRLMDMTAERVGNDNSAANGHRGITGLLKSQVKIDGNTIHLKYTGKSGVKQDKTVTDEKLAESLAKALTLSKSKYLFCTSDGFKIKNDRINRYLSDFQVTAKDLRGFAANKWLIQKLKAYDIAGEEKERKKEFNRLAKLVAAKVGHGTTMLKNQYLVPGLEDQYIKHGNIIDIHDIDSYKRGGQIVKKNKTLSISAKKKVDRPLKKDGGDISETIKLTLIHNKEKAPYLGSRFGQDVEPSGYYAIEKPETFSGATMYETVEFISEKPLYVDVTSDTLVSWKYDLSNKYKAKRKRLTDKLLKNGYDAIITRYPNGDTGEIVILATDKIKKIDTLSAGGKISKTNIPFDLFEEELAEYHTPSDLFE